MRINAKIYSYIILVKRMKQKIKSGIKIYVFLVVYVVLAAVLYSTYIVKTNQDFNLIAKLVVGGLAYLLVGFAFGNAIHKKGLIVGLLVGVIHFFLLKLIFFLSKGQFNFEILPFLIQITLAGVGGLLGVNLKKIF